MSLRTVQMPLLHLLLMVSACAPAAPPAASASAASAPLIPTSTPANETPAASAPKQKEKPEWLKQWFAVEEAMGAQCMESGSDGMEEILFLDASCYGDCRNIYLNSSVKSQSAILFSMNNRKKCLRRQPGNIKPFRVLENALISLFTQKVTVISGSVHLKAQTPIPLST